MKKANKKRYCPKCNADLESMNPNTTTCDCCGFELCKEGEYKE